MRELDRLAEMLIGHGFMVSVRKQSTPTLMTRIGDRYIGATVTPNGIGLTDYDAGTQMFNDAIDGIISAEMAFAQIREWLRDA